MRAAKILLSVVVVLLLAGGAVFAVLAWESEIAPRDGTQALDFPPELVEEGARLAAVGNCIACHTVPGGRAFSGGLPIPTPFGTIHSTNITPDPETGIGLWTEEAFIRSMREGVDREGRHLYPAFPYDHFTLVTDEDNRALYAYLMTREPVNAAAPPNELPFPLNVRPLLAGWKLLFLDEGVYEPVEAQSEEWNRGAYLAEGLGHCGACHTPRNALGALDRDRHFGGGEAEGWHAFAIDATSPAPVPWTSDSIAFYLREGWHELHGVSHGPMAEVTGNLAGLPDEDIGAIATYVASVMGEPSAGRIDHAERLLGDIEAGPGGMVPAADAQTVASIGEEGQGAAIYAAACAVCHEAGRPLPYGGLDLRLSTAVNAPDPQNIVNVTLFGLPPADGEPNAIMPGFAGALSDSQVADLLAYMRARFSGGEAWEDVEETVRRTRSGEHHVTVHPSHGIERAPVNVGAVED